MARLPLVNFSAIVDRLNAGISQIESIASTSSHVALSSIRKAQPEVRQQVIKFLISNYKKSGLGTMTKGRESTGTMLKAISESEVLISTKQSGDSITKPKISVRFKGGAKGYDNGSSVYVVAGSLNYGAVYSPEEAKIQVDLPTQKIRGKFGGKNILGSKAKRSVKKLAIGQAVSNKTLQSIARTQYVRQHTGSGKGKPRRYGNEAVTLYKGVQIRGEDIKRGAKSTKISGLRDDKRVGIHVINPHPFFYLDDSQLNAISEILKRSINRSLGKE